MRGVRTFGWSLLALAAPAIPFILPVSVLLAYRDGVLAAPLSPYRAMVVACPADATGGLRIVAAYSTEFLVALAALVWIAGRLRHRPDPLSDQALAGPPRWLPWVMLVAAVVALLGFALPRRGAFAGLEGCGDGLSATRLCLSVAGYAVFLLLATLVFQIRKRN